MVDPWEEVPRGWSEQQLTKTGPDVVSVQAHGMPVALSHISGRDVSPWLQQLDATVSPRRRALQLCRWQGRQGKNRTFPLGQSDICPPSLHSTSFPNMPLQLSPSFALSSVYSEFSLGSIHMSLPNSQVASCAVSRQLDYKLLKVCASPPFSPITPTQTWAEVQERVAEKRAQWINLSELSGKEGWWYCGLFLAGAACTQGIGFFDCQARHSYRDTGVCLSPNVAPILTFLYAMLHTSFLNLSEAHAFLSIGNQA